MKTMSREKSLSRFSELNHTSPPQSSANLHLLCICGPESVAIAKNREASFHRAAKATSSLHEGIGSASDHTFLFGPRVSVSVGKLKPFVHGLFGEARTKGNGSGLSISDTAFATALGGGVDYRLVRGI